MEVIDSVESDGMIARSPKQVTDGFVVGAPQSGLGQQRASRNSSVDHCRVNLDFARSKHLGT